MHILNVGESYCLRFYGKQTSMNGLIAILEAEHMLVKKVRLKKAVTDATNNLKLKLVEFTDLSKDEIELSVKELRKSLKEGEVIYSRNEDGIQVTYKTKSPYGDIVLGMHSQVYSKTNLEIKNERMYDKMGKNKKNKKEELNLVHEEVNIIIEDAISEEEEIDVDIVDEIVEAELEDIAMEETKEEEEVIVEVTEEEITEEKETEEDKANKVKIEVNEIDDEISEFVVREMERITSVYRLGDILDLKIELDMMSIMLCTESFKDITNEVSLRYAGNNSFVSIILNGIFAVKELKTIMLDRITSIIDNAKYDTETIKNLYNKNYEYFSMKNQSVLYDKIFEFMKIINPNISEGLNSDAIMYAINIKMLANFNDVTANIISSYYEDNSVEEAFRALQIIASSKSHTDMVKQQVLDNLDSALKDIRLSKLNATRYNVSNKDETFMNATFGEYRVSNISEIVPAKHSMLEEIEKAKAKKDLEIIEVKEVKEVEVPKEELSFGERIALVLNKF